MDNKKYFGIIKVGYSAGLVGCTNEFFVCIYTGKEKMESFGFKGMYGVEDRVREIMQGRGYEYSYIPSQFGQIKGRDKNWVGFLDENEIKDIKLY
jgi:hypothetical protein